MKSEIGKLSQDLGSAKIRINQLEKSARQTEAEAESNRTDKAQPKQMPLLPKQQKLDLNSADIQIIRQYIKVAPSQTSAPSKIAVGDDLKDLAAGPIPESLVDALPKLMGARFSIDQSGAIIIVGAGSNRIEAVIAGH